MTGSSNRKEIRDPMSSYIDHLECTVCGKSYPHQQLIGVSPCCEKVLFARYDLAKLGREVDRDSLVNRPDSMWRYSELLPVDDPGNIVSLGEGGTPLIKTVNLANALGMTNLYIKEEGLNPTGTFKARGISAAVSKAMELDVKGFTMPSAGNAAGAAAAGLGPVVCRGRRARCPARNHRDDPGDRSDQATRRLWELARWPAPGL